MNRSTIKRTLTGGIATIALVGCTTVMAIAQQRQTETVERGEVLVVEGNDIMVKMDTGEVRHFKAPPGGTATVDGKTVTVSDLKPGMKLQRTITTTEVHRTVKSMRTVTGKVRQVNAPYVTFSTDDGDHRRVKIPDGTKFTIDGQSKTVFELRPGMNFTATVMTESPEVHISSSRSVTGTAPPPPEPVIAAIPAKIEPTVLIEEAPPAPRPRPVETAAAPAPAAAEPAPQKLPKTGTPLAFIGLLGLGMSLAGAGMRLVRNR
jgi:LPXTG-motif cell wall-anchored protein